MIWQQEQQHHHQNQRQFLNESQNSEVSTMGYNLKPNYPGSNEQMLQQQYNHHQEKALLQQQNNQLPYNAYPYNYSHMKQLQIQQYQQEQRLQQQQQLLLQQQQQLQLEKQQFALYQKETLQKQATFLQQQQKQQQQQQQQQENLLNYHLNLNQNTPININNINNNKNNNNNNNNYNNNYNNNNYNNNYNNNNYNNNYNNYNRHSSINPQQNNSQLMNQNYFNISSNIENISSPSNNLQNQDYFLSQHPSQTEDQTDAKQIGMLHQQRSKDSYCLNSKQEEQTSQKQKKDQQKETKIQIPVQQKCEKCGCVTQNEVSSKPIVKEEYLEQNQNNLYQISSSQSGNYTDNDGGISINKRTRGLYEPLFRIISPTVPQTKSYKRNILQYLISYSKGKEEIDVVSAQFLELVESNKKAKLANFITDLFQSSKLSQNKKEDLVAHQYIAEKICLSFQKLQCKKNK